MGMASVHGLVLVLLAAVIALARAQDVCGVGRTRTTNTIAGGLPSGLQDGSAARFNRPTGVSFTSDGQVAVADANNQVLRLVSLAGYTTTLAGQVCSCIYVYTNIYAYIRTYTAFPLHGWPKV